MIQTASRCPVMDLSSVEGPPVNDTRFSISQSSKDRPRPRIGISCWDDCSVEPRLSSGSSSSSSSSSRPEPCRPASTEVLSPSSRSRCQCQCQCPCPNGKQQRQQQCTRGGGGRGQGLRRSPAIIIKSSLCPGSSRSDNSDELAVERRRPRSAGIMPTSLLHEHRASSRPSHARSYSDLTEVSSRTAHKARSSGHRVQAPGTSTDRLVWLEDRQAWLMIDSSDLPPNPHPRWTSPSPSSYAREEYWRSSPTREPPQASSSSSSSSSHFPFTIRTRSSTEERFDPDDLPPPYESLGFNVRNMPRLARESRWSAVARRVGRSGGSGK
ncbi:hypothetical protein VTN02DRAFT_4603 [Thermoascus thermophilus]